MQCWPGPSFENGCPPVLPAPGGSENGLGGAKNGCGGGNGLGGAGARETDRRDLRPSVRPGGPGIGEEGRADRSPSGGRETFFGLFHGFSSVSARFTAFLELV